MPSRNESGIRVRFVDTWASVHLDLLRGVAAVLVLLEHARNLFFVNYPDLPSHTHWITLVYGISTAGHQAVICFFVLSGYFIGGTVFRGFEQGRWSWSDYLLRRFVRLWIVLIPTLLLCLFWDRLGISLGRAAGLYTGHVANHMLGDVAPGLAPHVFFANVFFLQEIFTPSFGSDGALWSLSYEFWYYILFPLGMVVLWPRTTWRRRTISSVLFVAAAFLVRGSILLDFPIWLSGVVLFKLKPPTLGPRVGRVIRVAATVVYFALFFASGRLSPASYLVTDYLLTAATVVYLWILLSHREPYPKRYVRVLGSRELARFSYTLYAVHTPLLVFLVSVLIGDQRWYPAWRTFLCLAGVLAVVLLFAYGLAFATEFRTDAVRAWLGRLLGWRAAPAAALPSNPLALDEVTSPTAGLSS